MIVNAIFLRKQVDINILFMMGGDEVAKNGEKGNGRIGAIKDRTQLEAPNGNWTKRDTETGRFLDQKTSSEKPFKGVRKEK